MKPFSIMIIIIMFIIVKAMGGCTTYLVVIRILHKDNLWSISVDIPRKSSTEREG